MRVRNNIPNARIAEMADVCTINFGTTTNASTRIVDDSLGTSQIVGDNGVNLDFERNLIITSKTTR